MLNGSNIYTEYVIPMSDFSTRAIMVLLHRLAYKIG